MGEYEVIFEYEFQPFTYLGPMEYEYEYEYEYGYNMWIPCAYGKGLFEPDCPCKPGTPGCEIPDIPCEEHYVRDCNVKCETFWYDGGDCDELNENAVNVQMVAKTLTSAPALAVGALLAVALVAVKARRSQYASCKH